MRWGALGMMLLVLALLERLCGQYFFAASPLLLFSLVLATTTHLTSGRMLTAWWMAGVMQDLFLSPHPGMGTFCFLMMASGIIILRERLHLRHLPVAILFASAGCVIIRTTEFLYIRMFGGTHVTGFLACIPAACFLTMTCTLLAILLSGKAPWETSPATAARTRV